MNVEAGLNVAAGPGPADHESLFRDSPVAKWYEDWSAVKAQLDAAGLADETDLDLALARTPGLSVKLARSARLFDANDATLGLLGVEHRAALDGLLGARSLSAWLWGGAMFEAALRGLLRGEDRAVWDGRDVAVPGGTLTMRTTTMLVASSRVGWSRVLHVIEDRTREHAAAAEAERVRDILKAIGFAAKRFLGASDWRSEINDVLGTLGTAAGTSRANIFEHVQGDAGPAMRKIYEWTAPDVSAELDRKDRQNLVVEGSGYDSWVPQFEAGRFVTQLTRDAPSRIQSELLSQGILSLANAPIRAGGRVWGHIGFDQCDRERIWRSDELEAFAVAAGLIGAAIDGSAARTAARRSHDLLRAVIDAAPAMINAKGVDGRYILMNRYQAALHGVTPEAAVGCTAGELHGPDYGAEIAAIDRSVIATGAPVEGHEHAFIDTQGVARVISLTKVPLRDDAGSVIQIVTVAHDITERRQAEERVREALAVAEGANRSKSEFIANVSHELRTPLNAIIGFSEVMLKTVRAGSGDPGHADFLQGILDSGRHLLEIVNDLLDLMRLDAGRLSMVEGPMRFERLAPTVMRLVRERAAEARLTLECEVAPNLPAVWGDERRIKQILINLLTNAIKFTPVGGTVRLTVNLADDGRVAFAVSDSGIGMTADEITIALTAFGQVDGALSRNHGGVGLGLPLCTSMAEMHQGTLDVESVPDHGTTVIVRLPKERVMPAGRQRRAPSHAGLDAVAAD
ncbi:MAG: sensor histidine kinase [Alphaproteobacteria bacterium]